MPCYTQRSTRTIFRQRWTCRHCLPVTLSRGGCSFQFGRTSMCRPRPPHLAHTTLLANHGTSVSPGYFDTSTRPWWRQASWRQVATSRCTPRWRMSSKVIAGPGGCFGAMVDIISGGSNPTRVVVSRSEHNGAAENTCRAPKHPIHLSVRGSW